MSTDQDVEPVAVVAVAPPDATTWPIVRKSAAAIRTANLHDYDAERASFTWADAHAQLDGLPDGGLNIAYEAVDRHLHTPVRDHTALRLVHADETVTAVSYRQLAELSGQFANVLAGLGVGAGDRVFLLLGRRLELYIALLGALKHRAVVSPLFAAYGPGPVCQRLRLGEARVLVTTRSLYRRKVLPLRDDLPELRHVIVVDGVGDETGTLDYSALMAAAASDYTVGATDPEDMALLHFTSGTTGTPKGAVHVHEAVVMHHTTGRYALDLHPGDVYWCTADPGWVTGTSYGVIAPLCHGVTLVVDEAEFDAARWWRILTREKVNVWYTAPTALRMLMRSPGTPRLEHDLSALRFVASVGEPLNPEIVLWGEQALGLPVHDNWWQTETGGIMVANFAGCDIKPGSMGRPLPGVEAAIVRRDANGDPVIRGDRAELAEAPDEVGVLALRPGWPSMFRGYLHEYARYRACFQGGWYLSGDLVRRDSDGYFWFVGRGDDVIKSAGHLIGPFEVESALLEHPAVTEAGVVGKPDDVVGEVVVAYVALRPPYEPSDELRRELIGFTRKRLGAAVAPREVHFLGALPHTQSGKILRRELKAMS
ncbi:MAG TPA: acetate--CoA ligase [Mycobacteriales bacterium]|nr:acetate--CoA ligase [Mycobacteriales bacterium]